MKPYSIARRLITTVLMVELVSAVCVTAMAWYYEQHSHFRSFDVLLRGRADSLLGSVQDAEDPEDNVMLDKSDLNVPAEDVYEVWDEKGRLLGRSPNWSGSSQFAAAERVDGYHNINVNGKRYRSLLLHGVRVVDPGDRGGGVPHRVTIIYGSPTKRVWEAVARGVKYYAVASVLLLLVTGLVMVWLLHRGMAPLRALAEAASRVSVNAWRFNPPEEAGATEELAPLVEALECTLQRLEHSFSQQRRFVGDAGHELKTAVAVVKSSVQLLGIKPRTAAEYQSGLERVEADCGRMEEIVAKMLTLARVESVDTSFDVRTRPTDISESWRLVAEQFNSMAELRGVAVDLTLSQPFYVALRAEDCSLLFSNLLLNALQHSGRDAKVTVSAKEKDDSVEILLEDEGDGIPTEALPHIFDRFYRGDPSRNRNTGGTGLGLSICKAIVDAAGGKITIQSVPGVGTKVLLYLPAARVQASTPVELSYESLP
jgi:signal transduction histidine kinase